jgi:c-di-GMP-binding flagellar brake protein YcgR
MVGIQRQGDAISAPESAGGSKDPSDLHSAREASRRKRRRDTRQEVDNSAEILLVNVGSRLRGRILDLSPGGCRICTDVNFPVGIYTRVEVEFRIDGLPFRLGGVIQAIYDRKTVGIRFLDLSARKREQLLELIGEIAELDAATAPEDPAAA